MSITCNSNVLKIDEKQWSALLKESKTASVFQTKECYDFYESLSFLEPFVFSVSENDVLKGVIVGYVQIERKSIKQFFTKRAIINGGPLLSDDISEESLKGLLCSCSDSLKHKAIYVETRNFNDYSFYRKVFEDCGFIYQEHLNFHNDTSSLEVINNNLGKSRKRDVKKAEKNENMLVESPTIDQLKEYYNVLKEMYRVKVHTPLFPFEFFEKLYENDFSRVFLISDGNRITEGVVCVTNKSVMYEWFACGIVSHTFATYNAMKYAAANGIGKYDMMGAGKPNEAYGVRDFKAQFGGQLVEYGRFLHVNNRLLYFVGKIGVKLMKKIKIK